MGIKGIQKTILSVVGGGSAFWKFSSGAGAAAAREVMPVLCIMRRPQGLYGREKNSERNSY
jgi:hypothetical protein